MDFSIASAQLELNGLGDEDLEDFVDDENADKKEMEILNEVKTMMMARKRESVDRMESNTSNRVAIEQNESNTSNSGFIGKTPSPIISGLRKRQRANEMPETPKFGKRFSLKNIT